MAHRRRASVVLPAFAALYLPARRAARVSAFHGTADAGRFAFRIVTAVAFLAGHGIAREAMTVAFARSTYITQIFCAAEETGHALAAFVALGIVAAIDAFGLGHRSLAYLFIQQLFRHLAHRDWIGHGHTFVDANSRVSVAVLKTRHALTIVRRIADEQRLTLFALGSHCVITTFCASIKLVRAATRAVAITLALDGTVGAYVTKIAKTRVWLDACASHATLRAHWHADLFTEIAAPGSFGLVSVSAFAFETLFQIETFLALR